MSLFQGHLTIYDNIGGRGCQIKTIGEILMDNQAFYNKFGNVHEIIANVLMICEGMDSAQNAMQDKPFNVLELQ